MISAESAGKHCRGRADGGRSMRILRGINAEIQ